jgi:hypothetical protein
MNNYNSVFLTKEDIEILTGKIRPSAQVIVLTEMFIDDFMRPDDIPIVLISILDKTKSVLTL